MYALQTDIIIISSLTALLCVIPGAFIVLKKSTYDIETITRSSVLGFVIGLAFSSGLSSLFVISAGFLAAMIGLQKVRLVRKYTNIRKEYASIIISGLYLACAALIITWHSQTSSVDIETILLGELALMPFERVVLFGYDIGSQSIYSLIIVLIINTGVIIYFYRELKSSCIDKDFGISLQLKIKHTDIIFPFITALSVAVSFQTAGAFLTIVFLLGPVSIALFYTKRLSATIITASILSLVACMTGYNLAYNFNVSIVSAITCIIGAFFIISLIGAPETGLIKKYMDFRLSKKELNKKIVMVQLLQYTDYTADIAKLSDYLNWKKRALASVISVLRSDKFLEVNDSNISLTKKGIEVANKTFNNINR